MIFDCYNGEKRLAQDKFKNRFFVGENVRLYLMMTLLFYIQIKSSQFPQDDEGCKRAFKMTLTNVEFTASHYNTHLTVSPIFLNETYLYNSVKMKMI